MEKRERYFYFNLEPYAWFDFDLSFCPACGGDLISCTADEWELAEGHVIKEVDIVTCWHCDYDWLECHRPLPK